MSLDLRSFNEYPGVRVFSANTINTEVILPVSSKKLTVSCESHKFYVAFEGVDSDPPSAHKITMPAGSFISFDLGRGANRSLSVFLAIHSTSSDITLIFEE
tara:strand:- start:13465 stop:13767 length:303 start_codon:yes stop_codon:yes gene_type:complete